MEVSRIRALRGPNLWSRHTAIEAIVSCAEAERRIGNLAGFEDRLRARFPEIGFLAPTSHAEDLAMAHALEFAALGLDAVGVDDEALLEAMCAHPRLINRPFVRTSLGARLCRPPERVREILPPA